MKASKEKRAAQPPLVSGTDPTLGRRERITLPDGVLKILRKIFLGVPEDLDDGLTVRE
jgi:hypothetical protein